MKPIAALEISALLYFNWKLVKKIYENQFPEIIEPYTKIILRICAENKSKDVCKALGSILNPDVLESRGARIINKDFLLFTAAAADIIIRRQREESQTVMPEPCNN